MKAVILAGGEGTRLRPLTVERPKPLVPLVHRPIMGHVIAWLRRHHIEDIVVTLAYRANMIQNYFGSGRAYRVRLTYAVEERALGTAGAVKNATPHLDGSPFVVVSGDVLTDVDLSAAIAYHREKGALLTIIAYRVTTPLEYGVVVLDDTGRVTQFVEKPSWGEVLSDTVNAGIYIADPAVLAYIPEHTPSDWSQDIIPRLLEDVPDRVYGFVATGYWTDIGTFSEYVHATADILEGRVDVGPLGEARGDRVWVGEHVTIAPDALIEGPVYLGPGVKVLEGARIQGPTVIRDYSIVDRYARISRSIVWRNTYIGEGTEIQGAIVGRQCTVRDKAVVLEGAVVGDACVIGEGAIIYPGVKLWAHKEVEPGAAVRTHIVWSMRGRRRLFGRFGITGVVNVDLTPEFCAKLGAAIGAVLPMGSAIIMNRDPHRSSRMLKRALIAGLPSAGVHVWDVHSVPVPVARYSIRTTEAVGGIHVRLSPFDPRVVDIRIFDATGMNIDAETERLIERVYFREDFRRAYQADIGLITDAPNVVEHYIDAFLAAIEQDIIREARLRIVVDYTHAPTVDVLPLILSRLGVDVIPLNAYVDEQRIAHSSETLAQQVRQLATIVRVLHTHLGVQIDGGGERLTLVTERGEILRPDHAALAVIDLVMRYQGGKAVVVPVTMSQAVEKVVGFHGGYVIRARYNLQDLMRHSTHPDVILATDGRGHFIFPQFQPVVDGLFALVKILELLSRYQTVLSEVLQQLPPIHMANAQIPCPWEVRGAVMRRLQETFRGHEVDLTDGLKVWLDGETWVLLRPDPDRPLIHVDAEAPTPEGATALLTESARLVETLRDEEIT